MRHLILVLMILSACYRKDPLYCDAMTPCGAGRLCRMPERECVDAAADLPAPVDLSVSDLGSPADLITPAECAGAAQCPMARPVCIAGRCLPCTRNYQCADAACDDSGACHDKARILIVDDTAGACRRSGEVSGRPYCYLAEALKDSEIGKSRDLILLRPSTQGGHRLVGDFLTVRDSVRLVGARQKRTDAPVLVREPLDIRGIAKDIAVGIEDLQIASLDSGSVNGIYCGLQTTLTMRWSRIEGVRNNGLVSEGCTLRLVSNQILRNATDRTTFAAGVYIATGEATLQNNIIADNGEGSLLGGGVFLGPLRRATLSLNTLVNNKCASPAQGCNLACDAVAPAEVSYSIVTAEGGRRGTSGNCQVTNSVVPMGFVGGNGNLVGFAPVFVSAAQTDYHLAPADMSNKMLRRPEPNPAVPFDVDDDPRPAGAVDIGADQLP